MGGSHVTAEELLHHLHSDSHQHLHSPVRGESASSYSAQSQTVREHSELVVPW